MSPAQATARSGELLDHENGQKQTISQEIRRLLEIGMLCNDATMIVKDDGTAGIIGDPTEGAMVVAAAKAGFVRNELKKQYPKVGDLPFDSERKMMSTIHNGFQDAAIVSLTKGAPDIILDRCTSIMTIEGIVPLNEMLRQEVLEINSEMAQSALRVLAFAFRTHDSHNQAEAEINMTFVGLMGMIDPARPEARDAIALCKNAGIRAVMITGDYRDTAVAIANDLGLTQT